MSKRVFLLILICLLTMSVVSAQEGVTVRWWHINTNPTEGEYWQKVADDYTAMNPGVNIEITILENEAFKSQLITVMQAGDPPDLFQSWGGGILWSFAEAGLLRDIAPEMNADDNAWRNSFSAQSALNLYGQGEAQYGAPWNFASVGIFYNKALFEQVGLDPETPIASWEELLAAIQLFKDAGITPFAIGEGEKWPGHFWFGYLALRTGGAEAYTNAYTREGSFSDESFVQAYVLLEELVALEPFQEGYLGMGYGDASGMMGRGEVAMHLMGAWDAGAQGFFCDCEGLGENLGWMPFPAVEGGAGDAADAFGGGDGFAVGVNAPDEAVDFLKYITSAEVQIGAAEIWTIPTVAEAEAVLADDPIKNLIIENRNNAPFFMPFLDQFYPPALGEAVNDATETIFAQAGTPEEAAAYLEEVAAEELGEE